MDNGQRTTAQQRRCPFKPRRSTGKHSRWRARERREPDENLRWTAKRRRDPGRNSRWTGKYFRWPPKKTRWRGARRSRTPHCERRHGGFSGSWSRRPRDSGFYGNRRGGLTTETRRAPETGLIGGVALVCDNETCPLRRGRTTRVNTEAQRHRGKRLEPRMNTDGRG
jgi:hypothetical protein